MDIIAENFNENFTQTFSRVPLLIASKNSEHVNNGAKSL